MKNKNLISPTATFHQIRGGIRSLFALVISIFINGKTNIQVKDTCTSHLLNNYFKKKYINYI